MFLRALLKDGTQVVSEFSKLGRVERYVVAVFLGHKPFNAWKVQGHAHPVSGEQVLLRQRLMLNGKNIISIEQVESMVGDAHGYNPDNFREVTVMQKGKNGLYKVPETGGPEGVPVGTEFPIHRDEHSLRRYVILRKGNPAAEAGTVESVDQLFFLDPESQVPAYTERENDWNDGSSSDDWDDDDDGM